MGRSSRFLCFLVALVAVPTLTEARGFAVRIGPTVGMRPFFNGPHGMMRPRAFPNARLGFRPGGFRGGLGRFGRFGRGFRYGGIDAAGVGLGMLDGDPASQLPLGDGYGALPEPQPIAYPAAPRPCVRQR